MLCKAKVAVCSEIRTKHSTQSEHNVEFFNIKPGCTERKLYVLEGLNGKPESKAIYLATRHEGTNLSGIIVSSFMALVLDKCDLLAWRSSVLLLGNSQFFSPINP
jgi:hypothetical protein